MYEKIEELKLEVNKCNRCKLCQTRRNVVFGEGNEKAKIMFIGEGPGADEDMQARPFVGKAGKLMNNAFDIVGIKREDVYIANIVKCRPPHNRDPEEEEIYNCINYLRNQVIIIKPKIIVLLGRISLQAILGKEQKITVARGKWQEKKNILYMPTWHPAAMLRDETKKIDFIYDLKQVVEKAKELEKENL